MKRPITITSTVAVALLALPGHPTTATGALRAEQTATRPRVPLPPPATEGLEIPAGDEAWTMERLLEEYGRVTGQVLVWDRDTQQLLRNSRVVSTAPLTVPAERVHAVVELLLIGSDFAFLRGLTEEPAIAVVGSLQTSARRSARHNAVYVPVDELPRWREHAARLVQTTVTLPETDVRTLSNSLRTMLTDPNTQQIIPVGMTSTVILVGFAPRVVELVELLRTVDAAAGDSAVEPPEPTPEAPARRLVAPPPPTASEGLEIPARGPDGWSWTMARLLEEYGRVTGQALVWDRDTGQLLRHTDLNLTSPLSVPAERVHAVVELLMSYEHFAFRATLDSEPRLASVVSLQTAAGMRMRSAARYVPVAELERWAPHAARMVETAVRVPGSDSRQLANGLRTLLTDASTQQILPLSGTQTLLLTGFAPRVRDLVRLLRAVGVDAGAAASSTEAAATAAAEPPLLPPASAELVVPAAAEADWSLARLLVEYGRLTGQALALEHAEPLLSDARVGNPRELRVPPERVHTVVETLLAERGFVVSAEAHDPAAGLHVVALEHVGRSYSFPALPFVPPAELERWTAHPARLVRTSVHLEALDPRPTSNSLRRTIDEPDVQRILPAGEGGAIVIQGRAPWVAERVAALRAADAAAAAERGDAPPGAIPGRGEGRSDR